MAMVAGSVFVSGTGAETKYRAERRFWQHGNVWIWYIRLARVTVAAFVVGAGAGYRARIRARAGTVFLSIKDLPKYATPQPGLCTWRWWRWWWSFSRSRSHRRSALMPIQRLLWWPYRPPRTIRARRFRSRWSLLRARPAFRTGPSLPLC